MTSTKHTVRRDGMVHLRCSLCGAEGPPYRTGTEARKHRAEDGWSRCYTGSQDQLRCPDCRAARAPGRPQAGAAVVEWVLLVALIAVVIIGGIALLAGDRGESTPTGETWQLEQHTVDGRSVDCIVVRNGMRQDVTAADCTEVERG